MKIDEMFPESQFIIERFSETYRLERTGNGRGILSIYNLYIHQRDYSQYLV